MECSSPRCSVEFDPDTTYEGRRRVCGQRRTYCSKDCRKRWHSTGEFQRAFTLKWKYGITREDYDRLYVAQGGCCAICGLPETTVSRTGKVWTLAVDHDHESGKVRGLLCTPCNRGIGFLRDDPDLLSRAIEYLERLT